jgi:hypothetical protein
MGLNSVCAALAGDNPGNHRVLSLISGQTLPGYGVVDTKMGFVFHLSNECIRIYIAAVVIAEYFRFVSILGAAKFQVYAIARYKMFAQCGYVVLLLLLVQRMQ